VLAAVWFGYRAKRAGRNVIGWSFVGILVFVALKVLVVYIDSKSSVRTAQEDDLWMIGLSILLLGGIFGLGMLLQPKPWIDKRKDVYTLRKNRTSNNVNITSTDGGFYVGDQFFTTYTKAKQYSDQLKTEANVRSREATISAAPSSAQHIPASTNPRSASQADPSSSRTTPLEEPKDQCRICGEHFARSEIMTHVRTHTTGTSKPTMPQEAP
jgi:hypothetical protein